MTDPTPQALVGGESLRLLERAQRHVRIEPHPKGLRIVSDLPPKLAPVFTRALMRVEADVLKECADESSADPDAPLPSPEWVHGYAVVQLLRRIAYRTDDPPDLGPDGRLIGG
jgi:hypothetical protein